MGAICSRNRERKAPTCSHQGLQSSPVESQGDSTEVKDSNDHVVTSNPPELDAKGRCTVCRQEQLAARKYRIILTIGLFFPFALSALDVTIIASALPWIALDFHEISQMNWIISSFNLCSATFIPFWAQMSDIFGRMATLMAVMLLMMIGSALCTAAPTSAFPMLILGRAIQGMSVAGITVSTKTIISDKVSLKENAKNNSFFAMFAGVSYAIGPVIGGYLTNTSWRWCFGINLPVAVVGALLIFFLLRPQLVGPKPIPGLLIPEGQQGHRVAKLKARMSTIDFGGQVLFLFGMGLVILALTWGGGRYSWNEARVVAPLILGAIITCCFVGWQYLMSPGHYLSRRLPFQKPTIPWALLSQRNMGLLFYINFATGMAMNAVLYYVDIYFTFVKFYSPSKAGIQLLFYTPGIGAGVYLAMILCNFWPRQTFSPLLLGSFIEALGITILAWSLHHGHIPTIYGMMALTGAGTGLRFMPGSLHGIGFFPNDIASVVALASFAVPFGGTMSMTIMGTVFNNKAGLSPSSMSSYTSSLTSLPQAVRDDIQDSAKKGIVWAFIAILPFMWMCVLAATCLGNVKITRMRQVNEDGRQDFGDNVAEKAYLMGVLRRWRVGRKGVEKVESAGAEKHKSESVEGGGGEVV